MRVACESRVFSHIANEYHPAENARAPDGTAGAVFERKPATSEGWAVRMGMLRSFRKTRKRLASPR